MHTVVYVAVNGLLIVLWVLFGDGSAEEVRLSFTSLDEARNLGFWPMYVMVFWGAGLVIHAGATLSLGLYRARKRRRRAREERRERRAVRRGQPPRDASTTAAAATPEPGRRWLAVMFTDVVSSTALAGSLGDDAFAASLREHRDAVRACLTDHEGTEVGTQGDGFLIRFDSPDAAVACAVALQDGGPDGGRRDGLPLRIGIHAGEVVHDGTDDDLVGQVVNLAARVTDVATAGEILVTEAVADHLSDPVPLTDRGLRELKGFERPRHLLSVVWQQPADELDLDGERATEPS